MAKPRAFLFDVDNWLASFSVEQMTGEQVKAYLYLLCRAWHEEPAASLPNDNETLARMARVPLQEWNKIKAPILSQFDSDGNGRLYNLRLQKESEYCEKKSKAGASGWTSTRRKKQASAAKKLKQET